MEVNDQPRAPATLTPGKSPLYALDRRLGESQSRSQNYEKNTTTTLCGESNPDSNLAVMMTKMFKGDNVSLLRRDIAHNTPPPSNP
jgi:hypothetical protein